MVKDLFLGQSMAGLTEGFVLLDSGRTRTAFNRREKMSDSSRTQFRARTGKHGFEGQLEIQLVAKGDNRDGLLTGSCGVEEVDSLLRSLCYAGRFSLTLEIDTPFEIKDCAFRGLLLATLEAFAEFTLVGKLGQSHIETKAGEVVVTLELGQPACSSLSSAQVCNENPRLEEWRMMKQAIAACITQVFGGKFEIEIIHCGQSGRFLDTVFAALGSVLGQMYGTV